VGARRGAGARARGTAGAGKGHDEGHGDAGTARAGEWHGSAGAGTASAAGVGEGHGGAGVGTASVAGAGEGHDTCGCGHGGEGAGEVLPGVVTSAVGKGAVGEGAAVGEGTAVARVSEESERVRKKALTVCNAPNFGVEFFLFFTRQIRALPFPFSFSPR
jgi:hypothetical protein